MVTLGNSSSVRTTMEDTMGAFDQSLFIVLLVLILFGFEIQIVKIHQSIAKINERLDKR